MKSPWLDYKQIKRTVSILDVLRDFGIELHQRGLTQYTGPCPLPGHAGDGDNQQAFSVSTELNCWRCFSHCGSGNVIDLQALLENKDPKDKDQFREAAAALHQKHLQTDSAKPAHQQATDKPVDAPAPVKKNPPLKIRKLTVKADIPFLTEEKDFAPETLRTFGCGWCARGMFAGRVVVPIHNADGQLVAYAGRGLKKADIESRGKWMFPKGFAKTSELFNQHRILPWLEHSPYLAVAEGFWSVMRLHEVGIPAVGLMGRELSDTQRDRLLALSSRIVLALDGDEPGLAAADKMLPRLAGARVRRLVYPDADRLQPESYAVAELRSLLADIEFGEGRE